MPAGSGATPPVQAPTRGDGVAADAHPPAAGVLDELSSAFASARGTLSNFLDLASLEARRAGLALMWMVAWSIIAAICIVAAWLGLMAALGMWAVSLGLPPLAAVIAVALMNGVAGAMLISMCIGKSRDLVFSATRRQLAGKAPAQPPIP